MKANITRPFYPIIYVRGYAMTKGEIAATVATPYMGFNLGSTKIRQNWEGGVERHMFESPLVRLMKDYGYQDYYLDGSERAGPISPRTIVIYRYYEQADADLGSGQVPTIEQAAVGLRDLIHRLRDQICGDDAAAHSGFRVYLVAHSMGGLVCRCFLQNTAISTDADRALVDKVFTYATPHNGIDLIGINVPHQLGIWDINNFNRKSMAGFLGLAEADGRVDSLGGRFDPERFFCLVGTNHKDYDAAGGISRHLAGEMSDGLVRIANATVKGAPRAFVHRSHSGPYGIVNSEEGYQNLTRFLFGDVVVNGFIEVESLPLPPSVSQAKAAGKSIRASYYFESTVAPRRATYKLSERRKETFSAILRKYDEMLAVSRTDLAEPRWPRLFSLFLDSKRITRGQTLVFSGRIAVSTTGYEVDQRLWLDHHIPGEFLFQETVVVRARKLPGDGGWSIRYNLANESWGESRGREVEQDQQGIFIPLTSRKGFAGKLRLQIGHWE